MWESFCDRKRLTEWNNPMGACSCYDQRSRGTNNISLLYHIMKVDHNGNTYTHKNFYSHSFTMGFLNYNFPIGVQANNLQLFDTFWFLVNYNNNKRNYFTCTSYTIFIL